MEIDDNMQKKIKNSKKEILFISLVLFIGAAILIRIYGKKQEAGIVLVQVDGKRIETFSLSTSTVYKIKSKDGSNLLHIENGSVWLEEADCPDQICVHTGKIKYVGQSIICLPHKVVIEIKEKSNT